MKKVYVKLEDVIGLLSRSKDNEIWDTFPTILYKQYRKVLESALNNLETIEVDNTPTIKEVKEYCKNNRIDKDFDCLNCKLYGLIECDLGYYAPEDWKTKKISKIIRGE